MLSPGEITTQYGTSSATAPAYVHQGYDPDGNLTLTTLPTSEDDPANVAAEGKTTVTYWDTGAPYSSTDPGAQPVRFDYTAEGWQTSRIPEAVGQSGVLDLSRSMSWGYTPDGLVSALLDPDLSYLTYLVEENLATQEPGVVRSRLLESLHRLLTSGRLRAGDLRPPGEFTPWSLTPTDAYARIEAEFSELDRPIRTGDVAWFEVPEA